MPNYIWNLLFGSNSSENESSSEHSLSSHRDSLQTEEDVKGQLKTPFVANLVRRDSFHGKHQDIREQVVVLPEDHASYQEKTKERITEKIEGWKEQDKLSEGELEGIKEMLVDGNMKFGVLDTEEFVDSIRDYLIFKQEHGEYSEEEKVVNTAANKFAELLLSNTDLYDTDAEAVLEKLQDLKDSIDQVEEPESLRWSGIKAKVETLYNKINGQDEVFVEDALEMQALMASWPPSLNNRLLEHKSRVNTKILNRSKEMDLFDMPIEDLMLREASKVELEKLNNAIAATHSIKGEMVILKPEDVNTSIREFREYNNKLDSKEKKEAHLQYGKDLDEFVIVLNSLKDDTKKGSTNKLKRQVSSENFQDAAKKLKGALENQNPQLEGMDKLITALEGMIGNFEDKGGTKRVETAYKALIKAIEKAPTTLSPNVLALKQAQTQSKHGKDSAWYRDDLFKTTKGLAEGCAFIFEELNEYHKYINELNNFVLSLITVDGDESEEALNSRSNIIKQLSIEAIEGSVKDITNWQSQGKTKTAIENIRSAMGTLGGSNVPGALSTTMDALAGFKTAFDPIAKRNFTKGKTTIQGKSVATSDRDQTYDNPLNPSNGKEAGKGIAIMKGTVDTLMALKTVVQEFSKPPATDTLEKTINLCEKWNNAILNLSFAKDVKILTKNIDILAKYPKTSTPPSTKELRELTIDELQKIGGFSLPTFKNTIKQRLLESIKQRLEDKNKGLTRTYALRFSELVKYIETDLNQAKTIDPQHNTRKLKVQYIDNMMGEIEEESYSAILTPFKDRYHNRIDNEIDWREQSNGKASKIIDANGFLKKTPITTYKHIKDQSAAQINYYISEISTLEKKISDSTKDMDVQIFLPNVNTTQFATFATAESLELIQRNRKRYPDTYQNLIEKSKTAALPTTLKSMKTTAKIADGIDMMSSSFVQASRVLTSIVPDNDMSEENFQVGAKKWQAVIKLTDTAVSAAASMTAAFVGPYAPIPLLVGGIVKGITSAINVIIGQRIKASEARQYLDQFIAIFEKATKALQEARNKVSDHRESLQGWLVSILDAIKNINEKMVVEEV